MSHRALSLLVFLAITLVTASAQDVPPAPSFRRFNFNVGGGFGIGTGDVGRFVGAPYNGVVGGGLNFSRLFGFDGEYMYSDLPFKTSVRDGQFGGHSTNGNIQSASLNGIVTPFHGRWTVYGIFGVGFYRRSVSTNLGTLPAGALCQPAWRWWDAACTTGPQPVLASDHTFSSNSKDAGGYNWGGGFTYRLNHFHRARLYAEGRYHKAYQSDGETTFIPITFGLRW